MRTFTILPLAAALLLAAAAPVSAGTNTSNTSGSGRTIQGEWHAENSVGYVVVSEESGSSYGEFIDESGEWLICNPGADPEEEMHGFVGTRTSGWSSDVAISMTSKLTSGTAVGTFEISIDTVNECEGTYDSVFGTTTVTVDLVGEGRLAMFRNSGTIKVPGEFNSHSQYRGRARDAVGSVDLGQLGIREFGYAILAEYNWSDHFNG